jgi:hypothetical protein
MPELVISSIRPVITLPDFVGALADLLFAGFFHGAPRKSNWPGTAPPGGFGFFDGGAAQATSKARDPMTNSRI